MKVVTTKRARRRCFEQGDFSEFYTSNIRFSTSISISYFGGLPVSITQRNALGMGFSWVSDAVYEIEE